ncbi:alpha-N-acetylgalactosaminide alpha-2,6-sialyltransferase 2 isoform X2 [Erpetoichthys calabaricus]|uniref:alpha-N-acetylgalactosaminide alpha-2,6-sialyltransferase 2 isoform X2 n=1 Tax=Erpetoichthys calabaricus TaxID=27687 RepID=UPI002233EEAF|nr:alpha-N-acetylgalactosaminide alpha-2,6-sialyltransferase 2 isoform X2 [Erpetoichthys calabaricus]
MSGVMKCACTAQHAVIMPSSAASVNNFGEVKVKSSSKSTGSLESSDKKEDVYQTILARKKPNSDSPNTQRVLASTSSAEGNHFKATVTLVTARMTSSRRALSSLGASNYSLATTHKAKLSTLSPYLGDMYAKDDVHCSSTIRQKFSKSIFRDTYLEMVPVLQGWKHFSRAEYQRLRQYNGAHGWNVVPYNILNETLALLNSSATWNMFHEHNGENCKPVRCAVVGNGGILKDSKKGSEIDQHDYVFRTNGAVIKGFEEDVGNRTSFYCFSTNTMRNSMMSYYHLGFSGPPRSGETKYIFLPDHDRDYILLHAAVKNIPITRGREASNQPPRYFGKNVTVEKFKMFHPDFIRYIRNRFLQSKILKSRHKDLYRPSTGAVMLLAAVHTCDEVSAYGYMTPDFEKYSDHYYDKRKTKVNFYINHDFKMEMNLWQLLHKEGIIKLYMRQGERLSGGAGTTNHTLS